MVLYARARTKLAADRRWKCTKAKRRYSVPCTVINKTVYHEMRVFTSLASSTSTSFDLACKSHAATSPARAPPACAAPSTVRRMLEEKWGIICSVSTMYRVMSNAVCHRESCSWSAFELSKAFSDHVTLLACWWLNLTCSAEWPKQP